MIHAARGESGAHACAHQALFYRHEHDYADGVARFLQPGLDAGEPVAIAIPGPRSGLILERLGTRSGQVQMLDMCELGRNPARIIPAVHELLAEHSGRLLHYVGEPIWPGRSPEEIREATRHEALINLAWPAGEIRVLCPYDAVSLPPEVLRDAEHTHPWVVHGAGDGELSTSYTGSAIPDICEFPLGDPAPGALELVFGLTDLVAVRSVVSEHATAAGLDRHRAEDLVLAVNEVATNTIKHASTTGLLHLWATREALICQLRDSGRIQDPLAGRHLPRLSADGGLGLWMVNQLCDLVEARTGAGGNVIRLTMQRA